jgi:glutaconate CoA-transferase subunit A
MAQANSVLTDLSGLVAHIKDGDTLAIPTMLGDFSGVAMAATRALIKRGVKSLNIVCVPSSSMQADLLIGVGCVASIQAGAVLLYEYGPAARFVAAQKNGAIQVKEATCPAIRAGLEASERGLPFMPMRGVLGSDILRHRSDEWKVIDNPYPPHDPIVIVPAIRPDVALFHAPLADRDGNVWIGQQRDLALMAHAAAKTIVTVEKLHETNLFEDPLLAAGALGGFYLEAVAVAPRGAWPLPLPDYYAADGDHLALYAKMAATPEGFTEYLDRFVHERRAA